MVNVAVPADRRVSKQCGDRRAGRQIGNTQAPPDVKSFGRRQAVSAINVKRTSPNARVPKTRASDAVEIARPPFVD
jgi:hypothetical protein